MDCILYLDETINSILAYPPDHWSLEIMAEFGIINGINHLWIGLDGRSVWSEEELTMASRQWTSSSGQSMTEIKWKDSQPIEDVSKQCAYLDTNSGKISNEDCEEKKHFICMTKSLDTKHEVLCPKSFIRYKTDCFYHSMEKGDYNKSELLCAEKGSRIIPIKDRATYQFIRSWSIKQNFGDFYLGKRCEYKFLPEQHFPLLGLNYTTGISDAPVQYSDGTAYNKTMDFAFDDDSEKFGAKECNYMKKGVQYKPRDADCSADMAPICVWNSE